MAIEIKEPDFLNLAYNKNPYVVGTTQSATQSNLNCRFEHTTYKEIGLTASPFTAIDKSNVFLTPFTGDAKSTFDPSYIVRNYLSYDVNYNTSSIVNAPNSIIASGITAQERIGAATSSVHAFQSTKLLLSLNGGISHKEYLKWNNGSNYLLRSNQSKFLTQSPNILKHVPNYETLSFVYWKGATQSDNIGFAKYNFYSATGSVLNTEYLMYPIVSATNSTFDVIYNYKNIRCDVPVGLKNIDEIFGTHSSDATKYDVQIFSGTFSSATTSLINSIAINFAGFGVVDKTFTIRSIINGITTDTQFTFKTTPVGNNQLDFEYAPFVDDWVRDYILPKFNAIFNPMGFTCVVEDATAGNAVIRITTTQNVVFSLEANDTTNVILVEVLSSDTSTISNINLVKGGDKGTFNNLSLTGISCDYVSQILNVGTYSGQKVMSVYTDDMTIYEDSFNITIDCFDLMPNTVYKLSFETYSDFGGREDTLNATLSLTGVTTLNANAVVYPHVYATHSTTGFYRTGTTTKGAKIILSYLADFTSGGDGIGFYIDNIKLEVLGSNASLKPISEIKTYLIDDSCTRYKKQRVMWLNPIGAFDYFTFHSIENKNTNVTKQVYERPLPVLYSEKDRQQIIYSTSTNTEYSLNTGFINPQTVEWLKSIFTSSTIFFIEDDDSLLPVTCIDTDFVSYVQGKDKLFSYSIAFAEANKNNSNV